MISFFVRRFTIATWLIGPLLRSIPYLPVDFWSMGEKTPLAFEEAVAAYQKHAREWSIQERTCITNCMSALLICSYAFRRIMN